MLSGFGVIDEMFTIGHRLGTADHRDSPGANHFRDSIGANAVDESHDLILAAADFNHDFRWTNIHDAAAKDIDQFANFAANVSGFSFDFNQRQVAFDVVFGTDVLNRDHRDDLLQLFANLLLDPLVPHDDKRHPRQMRIFGFADGQRIDVVPSAGEHPRNMRKHAGDVLNEGGNDVTFGGGCHGNG